MNTSTRIVWGCICAGFLAVSSLPNTREVPAAASDGAYASSANAQGENRTYDVAPAAEYQLSSADVAALYTLHGPEIAKVWATMGAGATKKEAVTTWLGQQAVNEYCAPTSEPMTVCTPDGFCYPVASAPETSVVTRTVSYSAPQQQQAASSGNCYGQYGVRATGQLYNRDAPFMKRGPARRAISWIFRR